MPRYVVERRFVEGLPTPPQDDLCLEVVERNADEGVTWVHSYVSVDREKSFCICDAPSCVAHVCGLQSCFRSRLRQLRSHWP